MSYGSLRYSFLLWLLVWPAMFYSRQSFAEFYTRVNLVGGKYSLYGDYAVASVNDESSIYINPAGLGKVKDSSLSSSASSLQFLFLDPPTSKC